MKVTGLKSVVGKLKAFGDEGKLMTSAIIQSTADQITAEAKINAPKNLGKLAQSIIKQSQNEGLRATVEVGEVYGVFVEFGTGAQVEVPAELQDIASQYKGYKSGDFDEFLKEIKAWCKQKGIEEEAAYPIAVSILKKGLKPQPFLWPAYVKHRNELVPKLKKALERLTVKYNS